MSRFSQLYLKGPATLSDSPRFRKRMASTFASSTSDAHKTRLAALFESKLGIDGPEWGYESYNWSGYIEGLELRDLLDSVTLVHSVLLPPFDKAWIGRCNTLFQEESLKYRVDESGVVYFAIDEAYEVSRLSTLQALQAPRFTAVADAFSRANDAFMDPNGGGTRPIRETFEALEILFKLQFPKVPRLGAKEIRDNLSPFVESTYASDTTAKRAAQKLLGSMVEWVDGAHFYRHGQGTEEPASMPVELQVAFVNKGASFIRWLATIATNSAA